MVDEHDPDRLLNEIRILAKHAIESESLTSPGARLAQKVNILDEQLRAGGSRPREWDSPMPVSLFDLSVADEDILACCVRMLGELPLSAHTDGRKATCSVCRSTYGLKGRIWAWTIPTSGTPRPVGTLKLLGDLVREVGQPPSPDSDSEGEG